MRHYLNEYIGLLGYSTRQFADVTQIDRTRLTKMRADPEYRISAAEAIVLAQALGITVEDLYREPGGEA